MALERDRGLLHYFVEEEDLIAVTSLIVKTATARATATSPYFSNCTTTPSHRSNTCNTLF